MQGNRVISTIYIPGAASDSTGIVAPGFDGVLLGVVAVASNANTGTISLGTVAGATADIMAAKALGDSDVPANYGVADFMGSAAQGDGLSAVPLDVGSEIKWELTAGSATDVTLVFIIGE